MTSWTRTTHWANAAASTTVTMKAASLKQSVSKQDTQSAKTLVTALVLAAADKMAELNSVTCQFPDKLAVLLAELSCGTPFVLTRLYD